MFALRWNDWDPHNPDHLRIDEAFGKSGLDDPKTPRSDSYVYLQSGVKDAPSWSGKLGAMTSRKTVYAQALGSHVEVLGAYSSGRALSARGFMVQNSHLYTQGVLTPEQTNALIGKITAELPGTHTRFSTSYEWVPSALTLVDAAGRAISKSSPTWGCRFANRFPLPTPGPSTLMRWQSSKTFCRRDTIPPAKAAKSQWS